MKTKKYKTAAHKRMYGIEVDCKAYVEQGKLELVPRSSHYYRWVGE